MNIWTDVINWLADPANWSGHDGVWQRILEHLQYSGFAMLIAAVLSIPLGLVLGHFNRGAIVVIALANSIRALPTLGVLTLMVISVGIGIVPPLIALIIIAVPPMLVNAFEGVRAVDPTVVDASRGMGFSRIRVLFQVQTPNAFPLIILGIRLAAIQVVSTATIAAYVGLGGLGRFIFDGLARQEYDLVAAGAVLAAVLAIATELFFIALKAFLVSPGVQRQPRPLTKLFSFQAKTPATNRTTRTLEKSGGQINA